MERFGRSWDLLKACFAVLRDDKELLLFPVMSAIASLLVLAAFALPIFFARLFDNGLVPFNLIVGFLFYLCQSLVIFYFNAGLVGAAMIRLEGGNPTVSDGLRVANAHIMPILGYAAIAATVGLLLRGRNRRRSGLENTVRKMAGLAWQVATTLVIPLLISRKIGPLDAIAESTRLLKKTWGENLIGAAGIWIGFRAATFFYIAFSIALIFGALQISPQLAIAAGVLCFIGLLLIILIKTAISAIYTAVLYRYAVAGSAPEGFEAEQLKLAFGTNG